MKGKKSDPIWVAQFITESIEKGLTTPNEILGRAKKLIDEIDEEIKAIEEKKLMRSKLLDVIETFEKHEPEDKTGEAKILELFDLDYPETCQNICKYIDKSDYYNLEIDDLYYFKCDEVSLSQVKFAAKQMIKAGILCKLETDNELGIGARLTAGPRFEEYMKYVLQDEV